ncbi:MAG: OmpH family outer membrane protein [Candidatus Omnitrophota bacterium]
MKKIFSIVIVILFLGIISTSAFAEMKFGYVDSEKLINEYDKTKQHISLMEVKLKDYETERNKKVDEIKEIQNKLSLLSDKEKEAKKNEIENKAKALDTFDQQKQLDLRKEDFEKRKEIVEDITKVINDYAVSEGYTIIFHDRALLYADKKLEVTDAILKKLNVKNSGSSKGSKK